MLPSWHKVVVAAICFALTIFFLRESLFAIILTFATSVSVFTINRLRIPFDISPILLGSVLMMHSYNALAVLIFLLFGSIVPSLIAGSMVDFISILSLTSLFAVSLLVSFTSPFLPGVLLLVVLYAFLSFMITWTLTNDAGKATLTLLILLAVNIAYFVAFTQPLLRLETLLS